MIAGAERPPFFPSDPVANRSLLEQPFAGSWQLEHETLLSADRRPSKYNCLPSEIFSAVIGLSPGIGTAGSPSGALFDESAATRSNAIKLKLTDANVRQHSERWMKTGRFLIAGSSSGGRDINSASHVC